MESARQRRQVIDVRPGAAAEGHRVPAGLESMLVLRGSHHPGGDDAAVPVEHTQTLAAPGSPVRVGLPPDIAGHSAPGRVSMVTAPMQSRASASYPQIVFIHSDATSVSSESGHSYLQRSEPKS